MDDEYVAPFSFTVLSLSELLLLLVIIIFLPSVNIIPTELKN